MLPASGRPCRSGGPPGPVSPPLTVPQRDSPLPPGSQKRTSSSASNAGVTRHHSHHPQSVLRLSTTGFTDGFKVAPDLRWSPVDLSERHAADNRPPSTGRDTGEKAERLRSPDEPALPRLAGSLQGCPTLCRGLGVDLADLLAGTEPAEVHDLRLERADEAASPARAEAGTPGACLLILRPWAVLLPAGAHPAE